MFAKARHRDSVSSNPPTVQTPVSPLDQRFDLALDASFASPVSLNTDRSRPSADAVRTRSGDGVRRSTVSLQPPVLPPIPRVASRNESESSSDSKQEQEADTTRQDQKEHTASSSQATQESAVAPVPRVDSQPSSSSAGPQAQLHSPVELLPSFTTTEQWDSFLDEPVMEATMFPRPQASSTAEIGPIQITFNDHPPLRAVTALRMCFRRSRRLPHANYSIHPPRVSSAARSTPPSAASLEPARKSPSATGTNYSGSTARPSLQSSKSASASPLSQTIGTPYSETSAAFPAPQHVATRPKTLGSSSTIAGVMVPTHHTNSNGKPEKRKTRLLNPMALLARRRSGQDAVHIPDEALRRAHEQAQARQKSVATAGIHTIPEDFDPRIRGKIVHDFNAPRPRRTFSSNDADIRALSEEPLQSAGSWPAMPNAPGQDHQQRPPMHSAKTSDVSSRHSRHTPIFVEHLYDEPGQHEQPHAIQAERLENKDFLQRASHHSNPSQDSSTLPPFARRSQQMDPMQASFFRDDDSSKHSSIQSGTGIRDSTETSGTAISPATARASMSPVMSDGHDKSRRPVSDMSMLGGKFDIPTASHGDSNRGFASHTHTPSVSTIDENSSPRQPPGESHSSHAQKAIHPALRNLISGPNSPKPAFQDPYSARSSPGLDSSVTSTPEPAVADAAVSLQQPTTPPRLVEKRASAVGHSKRAASLTPKHAASNASRFSFQLDASAAEEKALEEKHRRMETANAERKKSMGEQYDDEDDYFDEDAMDDEDEMEAEMRIHDNVGGNGYGGNPGDGVARFQHQPENHVKSDASSMYDDDDTVARPRNPELTYAEHPAFRGHSAVYSSRHTSMAPSSHYSGDVSGSGKESWFPQHQRFQSDATVTTFADSENGQRAPRSDFYLQPHAAGYDISTGADSTGGPGPNRDSTMTVSTVQSNGEQNQQSQPATNVGASSSEVQHPRFSGFKFHDSPDRSRPNTSENHRLTPMMAAALDPAAFDNTFPQPSSAVPTVQPSKTSYAYGTNETLESAAYHGSIGQSIRARNASTNQNDQYAASSASITDDGLDDMYFDDGGFAQDVQNGSGESINEDDLDHPDFAGGFRGMEPRGYHERHASAITMTNRDGPYPTLAKAQQRESQMLLEDLPLQDAVDPQFVPRRNPSEDAKRLGLSDQVPPLPTQPSTDGAMPQMVSYHQALADAANRAAEDGRFARDGTSTEESSLYSKKEEQETSNPGKDASGDKPQTLETGLSNAPADMSKPVPLSHLSVSSANVNRTDSQTTTASQYSQPSANYTMPRMSGFDFGFDAPVSDYLNEVPSDDINAAPTDDYSMNMSHLEDGYEDGDDDDFIAAANAEALAYDDSGFYGQEFGFFARARSDSAGSANGQPLEAINGGFFGEDGDDPLRRQKSGREPDLTPITERSEFSARNSFINFGPASANWGNPGVASPALARLPLSPLGGADGQAKARASGGGYFGVFPPPGTGMSAHAQQHIGASPASASESPVRPWTTSDSPVSATSSSSRGAPFPNPTSTSNSNSIPTLADPDATPRKPQQQLQTHIMHGSSPLNDAPGSAAKKPSAPAPAPASSHSRNPSDSVAYVRETVSSGGGEESGAPPRWVLERRRTSELGVEVVGRGGC
ncbi:hypothetical protein Q7P37_007896 [Cladosporium fusiforme]